MSLVCMVIFTSLMSMGLTWSVRQHENWNRGICLKIVLRDTHYDWHARVKTLTIPLTPLTITCTPTQSCKYHAQSASYCVSNHFGGLRIHQFSCCRTDQVSPMHAAKTKVWRPPILWCEGSTHIVTPNQVWPSYQARVISPKSIGFKN